MCTNDRQSLGLKGKPVLYIKRVKWLLEHKSLWAGRDPYTIFGIMQKHGLYSLKSNKKDCAMTIELMLEHIKKIENK